MATMDVAIQADAMRIRAPVGHFHQHVIDVGGNGLAI